MAQTGDDLGVQFGEGMERRAGKGVMGGVVGHVPHQPAHPGRTGEGAGVAEDVRIVLAEEKLYAFARMAGEDRAVVAFNEGAETAALRIPLPAAEFPEGVTLRDVYGGALTAQVRGGALSVTLAGHAMAIYR